MLDRASVPFEKIFETPRIVTTDFATADGRVAVEERVSLKVRSRFHLV
jgi:hypothetical protein